MANHYDIKLGKTQRAIHLPDVTYVVHKDAGKRFGRLVTLAPKDGKWRCVCDCGVVTYVTMASLSTGRTKSCGGRGHTHAWRNEIIDAPLTDAQFIALRDNPKPLDER